MVLLRERVARRDIGAIEPCLPSPAKALPSGPDWLHEIKHDGFRLIARRDAFGVRLITRSGNDFVRRFPFIAMAVAALPAQSCLIDGEVIVCDDNGLAVFELIRRHRTSATAVHCAFDLLELDGEDLRRLPLERRKARLATLLRGAPSMNVVSFLLLAAVSENERGSFSLPDPQKKPAHERSRRRCGRSTMRASLPCLAISFWLGIRSGS